MTAQGAAIAELTVPVRGDLDPLRADLAAARRELEAFSKSMSVPGGASAGASASGNMAKLQRDLAAANDNARKLAVTFTQMGGTASGAFAKTESGVAQLTGSINSATMDFSKFAASVDKAGDELVQFTGAAGAAGAAGAGAGKGLGGVHPTNTPVAPGAPAPVAPPVKPLNDYNDALDKSAKASKNLAFQQRNLSMQLLDTGQSLALGMPPLQVLLQQGPQIAQIWGTNEGGVGRAFRETGKMFLGLVTKFPLLTAGAVLFGGALLAIRNDLKNAGHDSIEFGDILIGLWKTVSEGIGNAFSPLMPYLETIWNAIVESVHTTGNFVITAFMDVYNDLKFLFGNFGTIIAKGIIGAVNAVIGGIESMVNAAVKGINNLTIAINNIISKIGVDKAAQFFGFSGAIDSIGEVSLGRVETPALDKSFNDALALRNKNREDILNSDPLGDFYDAWKENSVEAMNERLSKKKKKGAHSKEDPYEKIIRDSKQFIEQQNLEAESIGKTEEAAAALRYEQEMLNKAADAHIKLTEAQKTEIHGLAEQMAEAEQRTKDLREAYDFGKETFKGFFTDLKDGLESGKGLWKSFADAALNALGRIADKLLDSALDGIFDSLWSGGGSGGSGGILGSVLGWITGGGHATGTQFSPGGWKWVGERGPELMKVPGGAQVVPNNRIRAPGTPSFASAANQNTAGPTIIQHLSANGDASIRKIAYDAVQDGLDEYDTHKLPQSMERVQQNPRMR
ncbi:tail tape measure protein [Rhizobium phage RHph_TM3_3_9]|nr:tail tape measure protein [Rhizobium phage RHph_TM3_3_9]QIG68563.1 tail tape measure protein [Rhizobium phage RHph_TM3_3_13]QIG74421.1 tail tape measure protein [Rhizobium phage RHph_TM3_3_10]QXV74535.1 tail tape measure protein [Rhizobium phage RHEph19]